LKDRRPKRVKKPNKWLVIVAICALVCFPIPLVTLCTLPLAAVMIIKQYRQAFHDEKVPYGNFKGEVDPSQPSTLQQAPRA
jgi:hypothetical protein